MKCQLFQISLDEDKESNGGLDMGFFDDFKKFIVCLRYNDIEIVVDIPPIKFPRQKRRINQHIHEHFHTKGGGKDRKKKRRRHKDRDDRGNEKNLKEESITIIDKDENNRLSFKGDWIDGKCCVLCYTFSECCAACCCCPCYVCKLFHRARVDFIVLDFKRSDKRLFQFSNL